MSTARAFIFIVGSLISVALWGQSRGNILNAEYSWDSGPSIPLIASDGDFNSAIEDVVSESSLTFPQAVLTSLASESRTKTAHGAPTSGVWCISL